MIHIHKTKIDNCYVINGKHILKHNIPFHKKTLKHFTNVELLALENFIKAENES